MNKTDILRRLNNKDIKIIKESKDNNYVCYPKLGRDGRILPSVWKSWQVLQRYNCGFIIGDSEVGEFQLSELGKEICKDL